MDKGYGRAVQKPVHGIIAEINGIARLVCVEISFRLEKQPAEQLVFISQAGRRGGKHQQAYRQR